MLCLMNIQEAVCWEMNFRFLVKNDQKPEVLFISGALLLL